MQVNRMTGRINSKPKKDHMTGLPRNYDSWRQRTSDDEQEENERREQLRQSREDRADEMRDRQKDAKAERKHDGR